MLEALFLAQDYNMNKTSKNTLLTACILGASGVMIGAFGAHGLKDLLESTGRTTTFETAVKYHMYHALALMAVGIIGNFVSHKFLKWALYSMVVGVLVFSGSLYLLCILNIPILGAITPIGGVLLIAGWLLTFLGIKKGYSVKE